MNLALTSKRFGTSISNEEGESSLINKSALIAVREIATEEELSALPYYNGKNSLADYHYLQFTRGPLTFDQLVGGVRYVNTNDKSCVSGQFMHEWETAISNNIMKTGKNYVSFIINRQLSCHLWLGVIRPGKATSNASGLPIDKNFYQNFSQRLGNGEHHDDSVHCCMYATHNGVCHSSIWTTNDRRYDKWEGSECIMSSGDILELLLDLDEGTLSVYKNGRKLGVMKRGLAGEYCWIASMWNGTSVSIKRGTIPPS